MSSKRLYYAVQRATLNPCNSATGADASVTTAGFVSNLIQSVGVSSSLEYEQVFELGRLQIFENVEGIPSVEITLERNIGVYSGVDSTKLDAFTYDGTLWHLCGAPSQGASPKVSTAANRRFNLNMTTYDDVDLSSNSDVRATGLYLSNYSLNFAIEGPATESVTLVGNTLIWNSGNMPTGGTFERHVDTTFEQTFEANSGVIARKHVTALKLDKDSSVNVLKVQSLSFSISFDREDLFELAGGKSPYFKAAGFPVETTLELELLANSDSSAAPPYSGFRFSERKSQGDPARTAQHLIPNNCDVNGQTDQAFIEAGNRKFKFGDMNWTGSSRSGGDAGGGNATITHSFQGFNYYTVETVGTYSDC
jgi:hypothetical protein